MAPYIVEIGIFVVVILAILLIRNTLGDDNINLLKGLDMEGDDNINLQEEGFKTDNPVGEISVWEAKSLTKNYLDDMGVIDLRGEREKLVEALGNVDMASYKYPASSNRSEVRIGLERMIAEIDRTLEKEGRYLKIGSIESIVHSGRIRIRPT
jgi:hypothetical protein